MGPFGLVDYEKIYAARPVADIFTLRDIARSGAVVIVRPDQYVSHVVPLPLLGARRLAEFFAQNMLPAHPSLG